MRKNIVAGNWKMNTTLPEGVKLAEEVDNALKAIEPKCDVIICTPFTHLASVNGVITNKQKLGLGAENCADHKSGAYTGEVSAAMVASTGATYVILGHSERRQYFEVVKGQIVDGLFNLSAEDFSKIILAYEPVWAIGTGKTATSDQAEEIHAFIRSTIAEKYGKEVAENTSILYGGSCKPSNAKEIFSKENVDGGLIGGAALKAADFKGIIDAWK